MTSGSEDMGVYSPSGVKCTNQATKNSAFTTDRMTGALRGNPAPTLLQRIFPDAASALTVRRAVVERG